MFNSSPMHAGCERRLSLRFSAEKTFKVNLKISSWLAVFGSFENPFLRHPVFAEIQHASQQMASLSDCFIDLTSKRG